MNERTRFADELAQWGPAATRRQAIDLPAARRYCRQLARSHYENFIVGSCLTPRSLRDDFFALYSYCRWADDLADEVEDAERSLALLDWWERELEAALAGDGQHPATIAVADTVRRRALDPQHLRDLLLAFRQDQVKRRYADFAELLDYCRYSAQPVGRLVLELAEAADDQRQAWADAICTGLQLANFCQDVARDFANGRIYLPEDSLQRFGVDPASFPLKRCSAGFRDLLAVQVARAEAFFATGAPLAETTPSWLAAEVRLFLGGGRAVLCAIRRQRYDVWKHRPRVSRWRQMRLVAAAAWRAWRG